MDAKHCEAMGPEFLVPIDQGIAMSHNVSSLACADEASDLDLLAAKMGIFKNPLAIPKPPHEESVDTSGTTDATKSSEHQPMDSCGSQ